ncbi:hypothetical protein GIB67_042310 [Kingdonia uniflora]|uniref:Rhodanese-like domain-containing protein 4, chloroplastic n=1 Tax=Kingdonia uniflora TaxID=39325 RepID=A0A7J7LE44_9MAGN|nr:hypothetical protein GIB67_042310 [Kingdonia uniflora]
MEALNAASLTPIVSVLSERRTESRKISPQLKLSKPTTLSATPSSKSDVFSRNINGGLVFLSSVIYGGLARALTYEEALELGTSSTSGGGFDVSGIVDFVTENPAVVFGGVSILAVPLVLSLFKNSGKSWGIESARNSYEKLAKDVGAQLIDIRGVGEVKEVGSPDIRGLKKKAVGIVYKGDDKQGFLKKLSLKFKEPENTTLFILDKFDGNSELVAELVTVNGFKAAFAIKDGAEGTRGWMSSGLPWIEPKQTLSFDFGSFTESITGAIEGSEALSLTLGVAAATGLGLLAFTEIETLLQLLGSAALVQFASKKLLFAQDRKETLQQFDEFLTTKIAPKELVGEIKQIGIALLPSPVMKKALPAPTKATVQKAATEPGEVKVEVATEPAEIRVEAAAESAKINSVPKTKDKVESLSPFPYYPDFKPPTSPSPSRP